MEEDPTYDTRRVTISDDQVVALAHRMLAEGSLYSFAAYSDARLLAGWVADRAGVRAPAQQRPRKRIPLNVLRQVPRVLVRG